MVYGLCILLYYVWTPIQLILLCTGLCRLTVIYTGNFLQLVIAIIGAIVRPAYLAVPGALEKELYKLVHKLVFILKFSEVFSIAETLSQLVIQQKGRPCCKYYTKGFYISTSVKLCQITATVTFITASHEPVHSVKITLKMDCFLTSPVLERPLTELLYPINFTCTNTKEQSKTKVTFLGGYRLSKWEK